MKDVPFGESGLIIYDGSCGACTRYIRDNESFYARCGYNITPLQEEWVCTKFNFNSEELLKAIHLVKPDGQVLVGADAFREICKNVWWLKPVYLFSILPLFSWAFNFGYAFFARRRSKISKLCRLEP